MVLMVSIYSFRVMGVEPLVALLGCKRAGALLSAIRWNVAKYHISRTGEVMRRCMPTTSSEKIAPDIEIHL